ncbi:DNA polymerase III subunit delta [bacterium]|nr:DNA polymerase III subunit delta [bacterium]
MAIYFYYGSEDFNIDLEVEKQKSSLNQDFIPMNYQTLDNPEFTNLITALRTPPMMFGDTLIVINAYDYFFSKKTYFNDIELKDIENALNNNPETLNIIFVVKLPRDEEKKIDSRKKLFKILSKFNVKEFQQFKSYKTTEISAWVRSHAKKYKDLTFNNDALEFLVEQIGNNLREFDIELDKLRLIAYPEKNITIKMVEDISISNQDVFNITDLYIKNQKGKALLEFKKLTDKKYPLEILAVIQTVLKKWIIIKTKSGTTPFELSKLTGWHEFVVKQNIEKLKNVNMADLVKLKQNLYNAECKIKSAESLDIISEVEIAIIR